MIRHTETLQDMFLEEYLAKYGDIPVDPRFHKWVGAQLIQRSLDGQGYTLLFATVTGSHMYRMERPCSDFDISVVYQAPTSRILRGEPVSPTLEDFTHQHGPDQRSCDEQYRELGHLIQQLVEGNVNAIWQVCSPIVAINHPYLGRIRALTLDNLSKASYKSIRGMAISQFKDETKRAGRIPVGKGHWSAIRTCHFGIQLLRDHVVRFSPVETRGRFTAADVQNWLAALDKAYEESTLPETPNEALYRDLLENMRLGRDL